VRALGLSLVCLIGSFGCVAPDVEIAGKPCPCPDGYACDDASKTCVEGQVVGGSAGGGGPPGTGGSGAGGPCLGVCGRSGCGPCPSAAMIDVGDFRIDPYEVTNADYQSFLADPFDPAGQPSVCAWNDAVAPHTDGDESTGCHVEYDFSPPEKPVTCVDWCDAAAFCHWAGKRMCGRKGGGTVIEEDADDPAKSEWYDACSAGGTLDLPYGNTWDDTTCNTLGNGGDVLGVGLFPDCEGGSPGLFDMVGNAEEWEDACDLSAEPNTDNCFLRGGAFWCDDVTPDSDCSKCAVTLNRKPDRDAFSHDWGFRCCSDEAP
jgi:formylglycine-generating enzyme